MSEQGIKRDETKPQLGLVAKSMIWGIATIMTIAVKTGKYPPNNWRKGLDWSVAYHALLRHLTAWWEGESLDPETGKSHLWHAGCELMFLIDFEAHGIGTDDRYKYN